MDGTNFWTILTALRDEGMGAEAAHVEDIMRNRTLVGVTNKCRYYVLGTDIHDLGNDKPGCHWYLAENTTTPWAKQTGLPGAGSEFAWDTTGQEEAYIWGEFFNETVLASSALNQILAYTPLVPNWAWHGSAYGMGDFGNNGWLSRENERVLQHYRSGLNSIPTTEAFLRNPTDMYALRLAAGSISGVLTNIDEDGAPAMAYHGTPAMMVWDPASGDHGLAFYGHSHDTQSFVVTSPDLGDLCYFCDLNSTAGGGLLVIPRDSYRRTVYIAALGLQIRSDAGTIGNVEIQRDSASAAVTGVVVMFDPVGGQPLSKFRVRLLTRSGSHAFSAKGLQKTRNGYDIIPRPDGATPVVIVW